MATRLDGPALRRICLPVTVLHDVEVERYDAGVVLRDGPRLEVRGPNCGGRSR